VFDTTVRAIRAALDRGHRVTVNCTLFAGEDARRVADFFDYATELGVEGITISPGYSYQHAAKQDVFLPRSKSKQLFRDIFAAGKEENREKWRFNQSGLFQHWSAPCGAGKPGVPNN
jgi:molybdenum cofactor biosynthesis enzyme MoaA